MKIGVAIQLNCTREEELFEFQMALLEDGLWNLIEYNCINCAGMYAVDRRKVFKAMIEYAQRV